MEFFDDNFSLDDPFCQILIYKLVIDKTLNNKFLSLPLRGFQVNKRAHLIHMKFHRILVLERV